MRTSVAARAALSRTAILGAGFLAIIIILGVAFALADRPLVPARYSFDEQKIQAIAQGRRITENDASFQLVGDAYRWLGLADLPVLAGVVGFVLYAVVLLAAASPSRMAHASILDWVIVIGSAVLAAIYLGHYSKDVFVLPIVLLILLVRSRTWRGDVAVLIGMLLYAQFFRTYWFIIAGIYIVVRLILKRSKNLWPLLIGMVALLAVLALAFPIVLGVDLDHYRNQVNEARAALEVNTLIEGPFGSGGAVGGFLNSIYVLVNFVMPLELMTLGGLYVGVGIYLLVTWATVFMCAGRLLKRGLLTGRIARAFSLLVALTLVQSIFEPDYGSYVRHLAPTLVLAVYIVLETSRLLAWGPRERSADDPALSTRREVKETAR